MEIGGLQFEHFMNTLFVNFVRCITNFLRCAIRAAEASLNERLAIFVQQVEGVQMRAHRDLDQLGKTVPDLGRWQRAQEGEVKKSVHRCMVSTQPILIVAIIYSDLDRDRGVNQTDHGGRNANKVGVPAVGRASKSVVVRMLAHINGDLQHKETFGRVP